MIRPNEFTYVVITIDRDSYQTCALYQWGEALDLQTAWPPFPSIGQILSPPDSA
jgi:hypothetical protein